MEPRLIEGTGEERPVKFTPGTVTVTPDGIVIEGWRVEGVDLAQARQWVIAWAIQQLAATIYQGPTTYRAGGRTIMLPKDAPTLRAVEDDDGGS